MSLFKSRQFWTNSSEDDEYFDQSSLIVSKLNSDYDYVITGSQSGVLRIFSPNCRANDDGKFTGFHPNDVIAEKIFDVPILQVGSGRLVSGSHTTHLAILHPKLLSVYSLTCVPGKAEHEDQSYLELLYEHKLRKTAYNFAIGPFGGHQNRDFICVQSLDGMLTFFEQDTQVTHVGLPDLLLPGPLAYIVKNDSFITTSCDWGIVCYRYKVLSESADESTDPIYAKPKIVSEWQFDLNEAVIDIQVINDVVNKESRLVVLGEKNLFCLTDSGRLRFMNKLGYSPICMTCYVIEENLLTLLISETSVLLVYENTTLKWSAHLDFLPIAISRAFLKEVKGALVLLGEEGRLECCYLGTEPSFFVAPPLNLQEIDFAQAEKELENLEKILSSYSNNDASMQNQIDKDLITTITVNSQIEICTFEHNITNAASNYMCEIKINLVPHVVFQEVQISLAVSRPLKVVPNIHFFSNLTDTLNVSSYAFLDEALDVPSLQVDVKVSVINNFGVPRTVTKMVMLPAFLILELCDAEKDNKHKVTLTSSQGPIGLQKLFSEYSNDESFSSFNSVAFKSPSGSVGTILLAKSSDKYRIQSDCFTMLSILVEQLTTRLKSGSPDCKIFINSSLPTPEILKYANEHFSAKQRVKLLQNDLSQLSSQFRLIQKRLITKYRAKNPISLKSLELLLNDTYSDVLEVTDKLENELDNLTKAQTDLSCALSLIKQLVNFFDIDSEQLISIKSAFSLEVYDMDAQAWEDVMDASLCFLLRTVMAKTEKDRLRAPHTSFDEVKDLAKFEKHLTQVLDRLPKLSRLKISSEAVLEDKEHSDKQEHPQEESKLEKPIGSQYDQYFKSCDRPCHELDWPMICRVKLKIEMYHTDNHICQGCRNNSSHPLSTCNNIFCQMTEESNPRAIVTANRQIPGPPIQVCQNDILIVDVINRIPGKSVTLHWRGQPNNEAPFMDGVPMVTQCPIPSYTTFQYKLRASKAGTHFYHAYMDADRSNGLFGALIVRKSERIDPNRKLYDIDSKEHVILISEWSGDFNHPTPRDKDLSKALLLNGKAPSEKGSTLTMFNVQPGKRHRFRTAYTSGLSGCPVNLSVDNHLLKVIELDGNPTNPYEVSSINLSKGERVDFILKANQEYGAYYLKVRSTCKDHDLHGLAVINYVNPSTSKPIEKNRQVGRDQDKKDNKLKRHFDTSLCLAESGKVCLGDVKSLSKMPEELRKEDVDRKIFLEIDYKYAEKESDYGYADLRKKIYRVNNLTFVYPSSPLLTQPMDISSSLICNDQSIPEKCLNKNICECVHLETVALGQSVEVILIDQGGDEEHILHFHGNHFYIVGYRQFDRPLTRKEVLELDANDNLVKRNLRNAPLKDTVRVPKFGVLILRFLANNPGIWMLRDENSHGWSKGLDMVIEVGERHEMVSTPSNFPTCGNYIGPDFFLL